MNVDLRDAFSVATLLAIGGRFLFGLRRRDLDDMKESLEKATGEIGRSLDRATEKIDIQNGRIRSVEKEIGRVEAKLDAHLENSRLRRE